jgi:hypothetical protein
MSQVVKVIVALYQKRDGAERSSHASAGRGVKAAKFRSFGA